MKIQVLPTDVWRELIQGTGPNPAGSPKLPSSGVREFIVCLCCVGMIRNLAQLPLCPPEHNTSTETVDSLAICTHPPFCRCLECIHLGLNVV